MQGFAMGPMTALSTAGMNTAADVSQRGISLIGIQPTTTYPSTTACYSARVSGYDIHRNGLGNAHTAVTVSSNTNTATVASSRERSQGTNRALKCSTRGNRPKISEQLLESSVTDEGDDEGEGEGEGDDDDDSNGPGPMRRSRGRPVGRRNTPTTADQKVCDDNKIMAVFILSPYCPYSIYNSCEWHCVKSGFTFLPITSDYFISDIYIYMYVCIFLSLLFFFPLQFSFSC